MTFQPTHNWAFLVASPLFSRPSLGIVTFSAIFIPRTITMRCSMALFPCEICALEPESTTRRCPPASSLAPRCECWEVPREWELRRPKCRSFICLKKQVDGWWMGCLLNSCCEAGDATNYAGLPVFWYGIHRECFSSRGLEYWSSWGRYNISLAPHVLLDGVGEKLAVVDEATRHDPTYDELSSVNLTWQSASMSRHARPTGLPFSEPKKFHPDWGGRLDTIITIGLAFNVVALTPQLAKCIGPAMKRLWYCGFTWDTGISGRKWRTMENQYSYQWTEVIHPSKVIWSGLKSSNISNTPLCASCQSLAQSLWCLAAPGHRARLALPIHKKTHDVPSKEIEWVSIHCPYQRETLRVLSVAPYKGENTHQKQAKSINSRQILSVFVLLGPFLVP